jgi:hypothetical protein
MSETVLLDATAKRLAAIDTKGLRPGALGFVGELDAAVIFVDKLRRGGAPNGRTVIAAKTGGFWCRVPDYSAD